MKLWPCRPRRSYFLRTDNETSRVPKFTWKSIYQVLDIDLPMQLARGCNDEASQSSRSRYAVAARWFGLRPATHFCESFLPTLSWLESKLNFPANPTTRAGRQSSVRAHACKSKLVCRKLEKEWSDWILDVLEQKDHPQPTNFLNCKIKPNWTFGCAFAADHALQIIRKLIYCKQIKAHAFLNILVPEQIICCMPHGVQDMSPRSWTHVQRRLHLAGFWTNKWFFTEFCERKLGETILWKF